jgi:hypothetical protein
MSEAVQLRRSVAPLFAVAFCVYATASLVHFIHNAEFLAQYPNLPSSWSRASVYLAWAGMTAIGVCGWLLVARGFRTAGFVLTAIYALLGLDSLGHYVVAPLSAHTFAMNATILAEVLSAASLLAVLVSIVWRKK